MSFDPREREIEPATASPKHSGGSCEMQWGNCDKETPANARYWGKPSDTPHTCSGPRRHLYRLHICETCGMLGARIQPSPYSKAGAQLRAAILKHGVTK